MHDAIFSIDVWAVGKDAKQAMGLYTLSLHGPNDPAVQRGTGRFDNSGHCIFSRLASGRYWVTADTKPDHGWSVTPTRAEVSCGPRQPGVIQFHFGPGFGAPGARVHDHRTR